MTSYPPSPPDPTRPPSPYGQQPPYGGPPPHQPQPQYGPPPGYPPQQYGPPPGYPPQQYGQPYPPQGQYPPPGYGPPRPGAVPRELLADWGSRVYGALFDYVIPAVIYVVVVIAAAASQSAILAVLGALVFFGFIGFTIWNSGYLQGTTGQSLGKRMAGTRLVSAQTGQPIGFGMSFVRQLAHNLEFLIGYLWPLWDDQKQTFADKICSTVVIKA